MWIHRNRLQYSYMVETIRQIQARLGCPSNKAEDAGYFSLVQPKTEGEVDMLASEQAPQNYILSQSRTSLF